MIQGPAYVFYVVSHRRDGADGACMERSDPGIGYDWTAGLGVAGLLGGAPRDDRPPDSLLASL